MDQQQTIAEAPALALKNLKLHHGLSQETWCFTATLYVNGRRCATVENDGHGGPSNYYPVDAEGRALLAVANRWADTHPEIESDLGGVPFSFTPDLDYCVAGLINEAENRRWLKNQSRQATLFRLPGDAEGKWRSVNAPYSERVVAFINGKYDNAEIVNPAEL